MDTLEITVRRHLLATRLEALAASVRAATDSAAFDMVLGQIFVIGRDSSGYHMRTLEAMREAEYYVCELCKTDFHTPGERGRNECRQYQKAN